MLLWHSALYLLARGLPGVVSVLAIAIYTRLLSPDEYGLYALVGAVVSLASVVGFQWLKSGLLRFRLVYAEHRSAFMSTLFLAFAILALISGLVGGMVALWVEDRTVRLLVPFGVAMLWVHSLFGLQLELARSDLTPGRYGLMALASAVLSLAFATVLIQAGFGVFGLLAGSILGALVPLAFSLRAQIRLVRPRLADPAIGRQLLIYGAPLTFTFALEFVVHSSDRLLIAWLLDEGAVGRYAVAYELAGQSIGLVATIVNLAAYPLAVRALEQSGPAQARQQLEHNFVLLLGLGLPAAAGVVLLAPNLAGVLLGEAFRASAPPIMVVVAGAVLIAKMKAFYSDLSFQLGRRTVYQIRISSFAALTNVLLNLWWIPRYGLIGAAWATLVAYAVGLALSIYWGRQVFRLPFPAVEALKIALATATMAVLLWPLLDHSGVLWLTLQVGIGAGGYTVMLWLLNVAGLRARSARLVPARLRGAGGASS